MRLDERKRQVLQAIVEDYIATAEPVGSRTIARKYRLGVSPATIRNEMADLEDLGLIEQPHTSAGRVPSDTGYRFYVDWLMADRQLSQNEQDIIHGAFESRLGKLHSLINNTARLLSDATRYTALVLGPRRDKAIFQHLTIVPLRDGQALIMLVTDNGMVENRIINVPPDIDLEVLEKISVVINHYLRGQTVDQLGRGTIRALETELSQYKQILNETMELVQSPKGASDEDRVVVGGQLNILDQPEFRDFDKVRAVLSALQQETVVEKLLTHGNNSFQITIGIEHGLPELKDCSLVKATYFVDGRPLGTIGVLGPKRMQYDRVASIVKFVSAQLNDALDKFLGD
ncbi:MAG: heat-inducible transcriptional repressor HrcA [Chloroflexota bacterium]